MRGRDAALVAVLVAAAATAGWLLRGGGRASESTSEGDPAAPTESTTTSTDAERPSTTGTSSPPADRRDPSGATPEITTGDASIAGRVVTADDKPVEGATVVARAKPAAGAATVDARPLEAQSDADGRFRIDGMARRHFVVRAEKPGHGLGAPVVVEAGAAGSLEIALRLTPLGWIEGSVVDADGKPLAEPAEIHFVRRLPSGDAAERTEPASVFVVVRDGAFLSDAMAAGPWDVYALRDAGDRVTDAPASVNVSDGRAAGPLVLRLVASARLSGSVADARSSSPIAGASVDAALDGEPTTGGLRSATATTGADGRWEMAGLAAGTWLVRASSEGRAPAAARVATKSGDAAQHAFVLDRPAEIRVRVTDGAKKPLVRALVGFERDGAPVATAEQKPLLLLTSAHWGKEIQLSLTDADGVVVVHVAPGPLRVTARRFMNGMAATADVDAKPGEAAEAAIVIPVGR